MLCPRCNSENETGEKFCRHCGAPLADSEMFLSEKEKKALEKEKKKKEKKVKIPKEKPIKEKKVVEKTEQPKKTYSLNETAYRRDHTKTLISFVKSVFIILILVVLFYFIGGFVLVGIFERAQNYSVSGNKIPSFNYVIGDRDLKKVKYSYEDDRLKTKYIFENVENPTKDMANYIAYLMEKKGYEIISSIDSSKEVGNAKIATKSETVPSDMIVVEFDWTKDTLTLTTYRAASTLSNASLN